MKLLLHIRDLGEAHSLLSSLQALFEDIPVDTYTAARSA